MEELKNDLVEIISENPFAEYLAKAKTDPRIAVMVRMNYFQSVTRVYIFKARHGGYDIVTKEEKLTWCHNHIRITRRIIDKHILHPVHPAYKQGKTIKPLLMYDLYALYHNKNFCSYVTAAYPQLVSWLGESHNASVLSVSVSYLLRHKLYNLPAYVAKRYPYLTFSPVVMQSLGSHRQLAMFNQIAKKYPCFNPYLEQLGRSNGFQFAHLNQSLEAMKMAEIQGEPFTFLVPESVLLKKMARFDEYYTGIIRELIHPPDPSEPTEELSAGELSSSSITEQVRL